MKQVNKIKKSFLLGCSILSPILLAAQTETQPATESEPINLAVFILITIAVLLAFVIWGLGYVLDELGSQVLKKSKHLKTVLLIVLVSIGSMTYAQEDSRNIIATPSSIAGISPFAFWMIIIVIGIEIVAILFLLYMINQFRKELIPGEEDSGWSMYWKKLDKKLFTKAVPVEREADVLMEHEYDGIRELDNSLPPWWKYGFYITIGASVVYLLYFHVLGIGKDPIQEYQYEMDKAAAQLLKFQENDPGKIDEKNLSMVDGAGITNGAKIYNTACWPCHGKELEGGAGPNLTDDYWLHKGGLTDIYLSIKHGYPDKGMQAWEKNYSPKEILQMASYIKSKQGTNPPGAKEPQGDLYVEDTGTNELNPPEAVNDSIAEIKNK